MSLHPCQYLFSIKKNYSHPIRCEVLFHVVLLFHFSNDVEHVFIHLYTFLGEMSVS